MKRVWTLGLCVVLVLAFTPLTASAGKLVDEDVTITMLIPEHSNQAMTENAPVLDWIYEATGIRIDLMPVVGSDYTQKCTTMIAADTMTDIMKNVPNYRIYAAEGAFVPLSDHFDVMPEFAAVVETIPELRKMFVDGKLYGVSHLAKKFNTSMGQEPMIRGDILQELNLTMPDNFDELLDVLRAMKAAYPQSYPWCVRGGTANVCGISGYMMGYGNNWYFDHDINGGEWAHGYTSEAFLKGLEFIATCYAEGLLDPDYASATAAQWQEKCSTGVGLYTFDNPTFNINYNLALQAEDPNAGFTYIPIMENWFGQRRGLRYEDHWYTSIDVVSASSEVIDACLALMNWNFTDEGYTLTNWGVEGITYEVVNGEKKLLDSVYNDALKNSDPWRGFMGTYGLGHLGLAEYVDESTQNIFLSDTTLEWYAYWDQEEALHPMVIAPIFTEDETTRIADLQTAIDTYFLAEVDKYITGELPVEDFVQVQQKMLEMGVQEVLDIYNAAEKRT